jgi:hypothetical protein
LNITNTKSYRSGREGITIEEKTMNMSELNRDVDFKKIQMNDYMDHIVKARNSIINELKTKEFPIKFGLNYEAIFIQEAPAKTGGLHLTAETFGKTSKQFEPIEYKIKPNIIKIIKVYGKKVGTIINPASLPTDRQYLSEILNESEIEKAVDERLNTIVNDIEDYTNNGSGWIFIGSIAAFIRTAPMRIQGSSYCELPEWINKKKCCLNIENDDDKCFMWSVLANKHPIDSKDHPYRVSKYKQYEDELNLKDIKFPMTIGQLEKFERQNNTPINVFEFYKNGMAPIYLSKINEEEAINIGLYKEHYVLIKSMSRLVGKSNNHKSKLCMNCLQRYKDPKHKEYCYKSDTARIEMPQKYEDKYVYFKNIKNMLWQPFVIYSDFECVIINSEHIPCGYCFKVRSQYDMYEFPIITYRGTSEKDTMDHFFDDIFKLEKQIQQIVKISVPMNEEERQKAKQGRTLDCYLCGKQLEEVGVADHDHFTGKYRGRAHNKCNLNYNLKNYMIPVFFHNLKGYDSHLIINAFTKYAKGRRIQVIPQSTEKYLSFSIGKLKFVDSFAFMSFS